jgi:hypothetical protein
VSQGNSVTVDVSTGSKCHSGRNVGGRNVKAPMERSGWEFASVFPPKEGFLCFKIKISTFLLLFPVHNTVCFSPLQVKNKPCEEAVNVHLFLGVLAWLQIINSDEKALSENTSVRKKFNRGFKNAEFYADFKTDENFTKYSPEILSQEREGNRSFTLLFRFLCHTFFYKLFCNCF